MSATATSAISTGQVAIRISNDKSENVAPAPEGCCAWLGRILCCCCCKSRVTQPDPQTVIAGNARRIKDMSQQTVKRLAHAQPHEAAPHQKYADKRVKRVKPEKPVVIPSVAHGSAAVAPAFSVVVPEAAAAAPIPLKDLTPEQLRILARRNSEIDLQ